MATDLLTIDGRLGEGGGQLLRTSLSLAAITGRPFRLTHIRAGRARPGLRPQHLTAVRAVAAVCDAALDGDELNSTTLRFTPAAPPRGGEYAFDVRDVAPQGSAGAVSLIFQALVWPLLFAGAPSRLVLRGGTHVPHSPSFHYLDHVFRPAVARLGAHVQLALNRYGWMNGGDGEVVAEISPAARLTAVDFAREPIIAAAGVAAVTNLPAHIPQRMARRAVNLLRARNLTASVDPRRERGAAPGAAIALWAGHGGVTVLGRRGWPADEVAAAAVAELVAFIDNGTAVDEHLADQLLLPLALAHGQATFTTGRLTRHTLTNATLLRQWLDVAIALDESPDPAAGGRVTVTGVGWAAPSHHV